MYPISMQIFLHLYNMEDKRSGANQHSNLRCGIPISNRKMPCEMTISIGNRMGASKIKD